MDIPKLIEALSRYGTVEVCKEGIVLTILLTGSGLTNMGKVTKIGETIGKHCDSYPYVEAMKNGENFYLSVLKRKTVNNQ